MTAITKKIDNILQKKRLLRQELSNLLGCTAGALNQMIRGDIPFSENIIGKLLPILEISREEFESWIIADKYSKEILELALQVKKDFLHKKESILTTKIDNILQEKDISRTTLSKEIGYSQSGLNAIITRKRSMSKSVLERLSITLDVSQDKILSWVVADKYDLKTLELAVLALH